MRNDRYAQFEAQDLADPIRGLKGMKLPWQLEELRLSDADGDLWYFKLTCINIEPEPLRKKLIFQLELYGLCHIQPTTLLNLGYDPQRVMILHDSPLVGAEISKHFKHEDELLNIEKRSLPLMRQFIDLCFKKVTLSEKKRSVAAQVERRPLGRFADNDT